ncbi:hypothetical protein SBA3_3540002 [Candidatus Sulfopaludibacter sp. SbA3]|nr:hypothetical protein SBA3_3540002 [Candidatus Sulfopaludibacter sp. SbA3]
MRFPAFFLAALLVQILPAQDTGAGRLLFENRCARCHGADGNGGELGPAIATKLRAHTDPQLATLIHQGLPDRGMPPIPVSDVEMPALVRFLRSLQPRASGPPAVRLKVRTTDNRDLDGEVLNEGFDDLQLRTADQRVHLLRRTGGRYREVTSQTDWPGYNGDSGGNRYTTLSQITPANVAKLAPQWIVTVPNTGHLEVTPVVVDGIMYVSNTNECYALDAGTGRQIWHYRRPRTPGIAGDVAAGINRGVAVAADRVFMETDHAHMIALNRFTGELLWDTEMADWRTSPLPRPSQPGTWWSAAWAAANSVPGASSRRSTRPPAKRCGASGPSPSPAALAPKPGRAKASRTAVDLPGSPARTTPSSIPSIGPRAIPARNTTATIAWETISMPIASSRWTPAPAS